MNIEGLGEKIVESLFNNGLIKTIADIYYLKLEDIKSLKKDGKKFAQNLMDAIEKSKSNDLLILHIQIAFSFKPVRFCSCVSPNYISLLV